MLGGGQNVVNENVQVPPMDPEQNKVNWLPPAELALPKAPLVLVTVGVVPEVMVELVLPLDGTVKVVV